MYPAKGHTGVRSQGPSPCSTLPKNGLRQTLIHCVLTLLRSIKNNLTKTLALGNAVGRVINYHHGERQRAWLQSTKGEENGIWLPHVVHVQDILSGCKWRSLWTLSVGQLSL